MGLSLRGFQCHTLSVGGRLFTRTMMLDLSGIDPVPALKLVFAEMALACTALSDAIQHAGLPEVKLLTTMSSAQNEMCTHHSLEPSCKEATFSSAC